MLHSTMMMADLPWNCKLDALHGSPPGLADVFADTFWRCQNRAKGHPQGRKACGGRVAMT
jgi:hypothetical protein